MRYDQDKTNHNYAKLSRQDELQYEISLRQVQLELSNIVSYNDVLLLRQDQLQ